MKMKKINNASQKSERRRSSAVIDNLGGVARKLEKMFGEGGKESVWRGNMRVMKASQYVMANGMWVSGIMNIKCHHIAAAKAYLLIENERRQHQQ